MMIGKEGNGGSGRVKVGLGKELKKFVDVEGRNW